jgi:hypothetical protein
MGGINHALLWTGSAGSVVDLTPAGFFEALAYGVGGGQQVGDGFISSVGWHAVLWRGTAQSAVDLHPGGFSESHARGVAAGRQVGSGVIAGGGSHALVWSGSANSVVDLHTFLPPGFGSSEAHGIDGSGNVIGSADGHAILWVPQP